jgi:hypothetical protein
MLTNEPTVAKPTTAYPLDYAVWMAGALLCPSCKHDADDDGVRLICRRCHVDLIIIERD